MSQKSPNTEKQQSWQGLMTLAVMFGYFIGSMMWIVGLQITAIVAGISATLLGMYIISSG